MNTMRIPIVLQHSSRITMSAVIVFLIFFLSISEINAAPGAAGIRSSSARAGTATATRTGAARTGRTGTASATRTGTASATRTGTASATRTGTASATRTGTASATRTGTASATRTGTATATRHGHVYRPAHRPGHRPGHLPVHGHRHYAARSHASHHYHRWYRGAAWFALGAYVATRPRYTSTVVVSDTTYYYSSGVYYVSSGTGYTVVPAPTNAVVYAVPTATTVVYASSTPYYYYGGTYYVESKEKAAKPTEADVEGAGKEEDYPPMTEDDHNYKVVNAPVGATVPYLPDEAKEETIDGKKFWVYEKSYYQAFVSEGDTIYMVVKKPG